MIGKQIRYEKLLNQNENVVIIAIDHGGFVGPIPGLIDIHETIQNINPIVDGVLLNPGMMKFCKPLFNFKGAPIPIMRLNWSSVFCSNWDYNQAYTATTISVHNAVANGAEMILVSLTLQTGNEETDAKNVEVFCKYVEEADKLGIPVIGEYFPINSDRLSDDELKAQIITGCRILAELGADLIKTFYTKNFSAVVKACPVPILVLGGQQKTRPIDALQIAWDVVQNGGKGVVFGRNAIQVRNPKKFQAALYDVVKNKLTPETAIENHKLYENC